MYLSYYELKDKPFSISTDPKYLWLGEKHKEAYSVLKYGVLDNKGFLLLTGDVGAGKTTLIHALTSSMGDDVIWATVPDPGLELMDFFLFIAGKFNIAETFNSKSEFLKIFRLFLHKAYAKGQKVVLIIDEAQRLTNELLEEIRMLSNIELNNMKLLNIFFVGQSEFIKVLNDEGNRALKHRITVNYHIKPLTDKETGMYIRHRLKIAGAKRNIFSFVSIKQIYEYSKGCPRIINILCDMALLIGYSRDLKKIGFDIIDESIESIRIVDQPLTEPPGMEHGKPNRQRKRIIPVVIVVTMIIGVICYDSFYGNGIIPALLNPKVNQAINVDESPSEVEKTIVQHDSTIDIISDQKQDGVETFPEIIETDDSKVVQEIAPTDTMTTQPDVSFEKLIIGFSHNSNDFSDSTYSSLDKLVEYMKIKPGVGVFISGYTDEYGTGSYNVNLSTFRANTVRSYLIGSGINKSRIKATGFGSTNPLSTNSSSEGRRLNRRVEIEVFND